MKTGLQTMVLAGLITFILASPLHADLNSGLVAYYPFNGNANDASENGRNLTLVGAAVTNGMHGTGLYFSGSTSEYAILNPFNGFPNTELSIAFWIKTTSVDGVNGRFILSYFTTWDAFRLCLNPTGLRVDVDNALPFAQTDVYVTDGNWHHVVVTWRKSDGSTQVFRDGFPSWSGAYAAGVDIAGTGSLVLGQEQDSPGGGFGAGFTGCLDEVLVYNRALSATEVAQLYGFAGGTNLVLTNVRATQRSGTKLVGISYDVTSPNGNPLSVTVAVSTNNGATFDLPASSFSGNGYGPAVTPGNNRQIIWDAGADWNGQFSSQVKFRVTANDQPSAGGGMVLIPAGGFQMGDTFSEGNSDERPLHTVYVSTFYMDKYEVSKALWDEVANWAAGHGYDISAGSGSGKATNHPVYSVSWYECVKWCNARSEMEGLMPCYYTSSAQTTAYRTGNQNIANDWVKWTANGYRLPTEVEWEKAARGGSNGHRFPWANVDTITHSQANYHSESSYAYDISPTRGYHPTYAVGEYPYTSPVGSFAANGYGLYDMAGNVAEWCWDWYDGAWYGNTGATQNDTQGPTSGDTRLLRGGNWPYRPSDSRVAFRYGRGYFPNLEINDVGFRCVRR